MTFAAHAQAQYTASIINRWLSTFTLWYLRIRLDPIFSLFSRFGLLGAQTEFSASSTSTFSFGMLRGQHVLSNSRVCLSRSMESHHRAIRFEISASPSLLFGRVPFSIAQSVRQSLAANYTLWSLLAPPILAWVARILAWLSHYTLNHFVPNIWKMGQTNRKKKTIRQKTT